MSTVSDTGVKREAEAPPEEEDARSFKLRKKTVNMGELYNPDVIPVKIKKKEPKPDPDLTPASAPSSSKETSSGPLKWKPTQWKKPGEASRPETEEGKRPSESTSVKAEEEESQIQSKWSKPQWTEPLPDLKQEDRRSIFGNLEPDEQKPDIKAELNVKAEETTTSIPSTAGLFKKRKAPNGAGRGRREI